MQIKEALTHQIHFRMSEQEWEYLEELAERACRTPGNYMRWLIHNQIRKLEEGRKNGNTHSN